MAWEWPEAYPTQALRAGAVAVKQYGWYYARKWRGGKTSSGACYDVKDTSADQIYRPETRSAGPNQLKAVATTWNLSIRRTRDGKPGRFILTGYSPGSIATCGAEKNGYRLYQKGVKACANDGLTYEQIARIYYGKTLQLTDPGRHNIAGGANGPGDTGAVVPDGDGDRRPRAAIERQLLRRAGAIADSQPTVDSATLARVSADLDGDGFDELISLISRWADQPAHRGPPAERLGLRPGRRWTRLGLGDGGRDLRQRARRCAGHPARRPATSTTTTTTTSLSSSPATNPARASIELLRSSKTSFEPLVETYAGAFDPADIAGIRRATSPATAGPTSCSETPGADGLDLPRPGARPRPTGCLPIPSTWYTARRPDRGDATRSVLADSIATAATTSSWRSTLGRRDHLPRSAVDRHGLQRQRRCTARHRLRSHQARDERRRTTMAAATWSSSRARPMARPGRGSTSIDRRARRWPAASCGARTPASTGRRSSRIDRGSGRAG